MNAMEARRQQMLDDVQALPDEFLEEALEYLSKLNEKARALGIERTSNSAVGSVYKAFEKAEIIGFIEGPADLANNHKKYLAKYLEEKYPRYGLDEIPQPSLQEIAQLPINERHQLLAQPVTETAKGFAKDLALTGFLELDLDHWNADGVGA